MKKVLALVLAATMILGTAMMASAAIDLTIRPTSSSHDYDYEVWLYEPDAILDKYAEDVVAYDLSDYTVAAYAELLEEYAHFLDDAEAGLISYGRYEAVYLRSIKAAYDDLMDAAAADILMEDADFEALDALVFNITLGDSSIREIVTALDAEVAELIDIIEKYNVTVYGDDVFHGSGEYAEDGATANIGDDYLYTYSDASVKFGVRVKKGHDFDVHVQSGDISVVTKKIDSDVAGTDLYLVTVKSLVGPKALGTYDWKVEMDVDDVRNVYFLKGKAAYSDVQDVWSGEKYFVVKSNSEGVDNDHNDGSIFNFKDVLDEEVRIVANDYVDLFFNGNYGTDKENLHVVTDVPAEIKAWFPEEDGDIDYYYFDGEPQFAKAFKVAIDADSDAYLYEYDPKTGDIALVDATYNKASDCYEFTRKALKAYVVVETEYEGGNVLAEDEPVEEPADDLAAEGSKPNPGTGAC